MSRLASYPVVLPDNVELTATAAMVTVKGPKGELSMPLDGSVVLAQKEKQVSFSAGRDGKNVKAILGMVRSLVQNMVLGVSAGFERRLELSGVGYRAELKNKALHLSLGLSHPVVYSLPEGVAAAMPSATEIVLTGIDKQLLGQVSAEIRSFRPPEPYKGKGVRYHGERLRLKETKKKK